MKLVASMIVKNELGRYLKPCVSALVEFCDEVVVYDDGSTDNTAEWLSGYPAVHVERDTESRFYAHEGHARQRLLDVTLQREPTHVLSIDADEFVSDGAALRRLCEEKPLVPAWSLVMQEVWEIDGQCLCIRQDGGWHTHPVPVLWRAPTPEQLSGEPGMWRIDDRQLACGREPIAVIRNGRLAQPSGMEILHFGWTNNTERAARYQRYVEADGGRFHARAHLDSIMWPDERVQLEGREWPADLMRYRADIAYKALA